MNDNTQTQTLAATLTLVEKQEPKKLVPKCTANIDTYVHNHSNIIANSYLDYIMILRNALPRSFIIWTSLSLSLPHSLSFPSLTFIPKQTHLLIDGSNTERANVRWSMDVACHCFNWSFFSGKPHLPVSRRYVAATTLDTTCLCFRASLSPSHLFHSFTFIIHYLILILSSTHRNTFRRRCARLCDSAPSWKWFGPSSSSLPLLSTSSLPNMNRPAYYQ